MTRVPVVPAFEIIASVAEGSPGPDGDYSYQTPVAVLRPWVMAAQAAGMYVILDLQSRRPGQPARPGRELYSRCSSCPASGLALDPGGSWRPAKLPLRQIRPA